MEKKRMVHIVRQENLSQELERFCTERSTVPLIMFYNSFVTKNYYPLQTIENVSNKLFGLGRIKKLSYDCNDYSVMDKQIEFLKALPQQLFVLQCGSRIGGYDGVVLYAERLLKTTGKHVIAMIDDKNRISQQRLLSGNIRYVDNVVETFLTWRERAQVWMADRTECYCETRQVFLGLKKHGILDMLKEWSEKGRDEELSQALTDNKFLNEAYQQYVDKSEELNYLLKYADFDERLLIEEQPTEYGTVLSIKAESIETGGGGELRRFSARWVTRELKLTKRT